MSGDGFKSIVGDKMEMHKAAFSEICLHCDLRNEVKSKVSYTVLGLIITVTGILVGLGYTSVYSSLESIKFDLKEYSNSNRQNVEVQVNNLKDDLREIKHRIRKLREEN